MYILDIEKVLKNMTVKGLGEFISENNYEWIGFTKKDSFYSLKSVK